MAPNGNGNSLSINKTHLTVFLLVLTMGVIWGDNVRRVKQVEAGQKTNQVKIELRSEVVYEIKSDTKLIKFKVDQNSSNIKEILKSMNKIAAQLEKNNGKNKEGP